MTSENGNSMVMPVAPFYGGGYGGNSGGFFGADGWWIILLLLVCGGGWGNGFGFGGAGNAIPFMNTMNTNNDVQRGFDQTAVMTGLTGIQNGITSGFGDVQTAMCGGFAGVNAAISNGFAQSEIAANTRQIANMQNEFAGQTAMMTGFNGIQSQLASCCCDNRLATANQTATILAEHCSDRQALSDGVRDIITNQTMNTQRILDVMCQDKIDAKNEQILSLQNQLNMANLASSQYAQTQQILAAITTPAAVAKSA